MKEIYHYFFISYFHVFTERLNALPGTTSRMGVSANDGQSALILTPVKS